jgi:CHAT domain-containing protein
MDRLNRGKKTIARLQRCLGRSKWVGQFCLGMAIVATVTSINIDRLDRHSIAYFEPIWGDVQLFSARINAQTAPDALQLLQQGRELFQAQQFSEAKRQWERAASQLQGETDRLDRALVFNYLSLAYQKLGQWSAARTAIATALSLLESGDRTDENSPEVLSILAQIFNTKGHLEQQTGHWQPALENWETAHKFYTQLGDDEGAIGTRLNQAQALQSLGLYRRARQVLETATISLKNQPDSALKVTGLQSLANALRGMGELERSRELLSQSLDIARGLNLTEAIAATQLSLGNTARAIAENAMALQEQERAKQEFEIALDAYRKAAEIARSPVLQSRSQLNQLSLFIDRQQLEYTAELLSEIEGSFDRLPFSRYAIEARINFAESLMRLYALKDETRGGDRRSLVGRTAELLATAIDTSRTLEDPQAESYALGSLGKLYELTGNFEDAQKLTEGALGLAQKMNAGEIAYRWQWQLGRILAKKGNRNEAIAAYRGAVNTLQSLRKDLVAIDANSSSVQFSFRETVEPVYREFVDLLTQPTVRPTEENLREARQAIESLQLAELDNFFQEACLDAKPIQIDRIDPHAAAIYPIILPDRLTVIVALPDSSLQLYHTLESETTIRQVLDELQQNIGRRSGNNQLVLELSRQVYDWLIRPIEVQLEYSQIETVVFVLDGLLRNVPMAALNDGRQYFIEKYAVAIAPGLQLLPSQGSEDLEFQVLSAGMSEARQGFPELPNVKEELERIQVQLSSQLLFNQAFTSDNLQQAIAQFPFPVVHIATHGQFSSQADRTFILSWDRKIKVKELDRLLRDRQRDVSNPIELLVFSACETADGDERAALGLAGVALRAGARSTLGTLWRVSDRSTSILMVRFYQELTENVGISKAEALRRAQLSLLDDRRFKLPYFWAPYLLVGNWR